MLKNILIFCLCATAAVYIRLYPLWGHIWSPTQEQATMAVVFNLKKTFLNQIHAQFPQMPFEQAEQLASSKMNETLRKDSANVRRAIEKANNVLHQQSGLPQDPVYLLEADPFYYYNLTANILKTGHIAANIKGNKYFNPLMGAPFGYWQPLTIHPYIGFYIYKLASWFNKDIPLMTAVAFVPVVLSVLSILGFMWCAFYFGLNPPAILSGCFYFALAPIYLKRSALGWYDTDPYSLIFPFIALGILFKTIQTQKNIYLAGILLSFTLLLYSLIWQGWIFLFFMTLICIATAIIYAFLVLKDIATVRRYLILVGTFLLLLFTGGALLYGFNDFLSFFSEGVSELVKFTVKGLNLWPNLFVEVGELKKSSPAELMSDTGGPLFILGAVGGGIYAMIQIFKDFRSKFALKNLLVLIFLIVTVFLTLKASRFAIFTLLPLSLLFALSIQWLLERLQSFQFKKILTPLVILLLLGFAWSNANRSIRTVLTPIYNSTWNDALTALNTLTPSDAIINTWWPPGHFIKGITNRRVPFDGATLSEGAVGYWMANALLSTNEDEAYGILRMLNLSGNHAVEFLTMHGLKTSQAVTILHLIATKTVAEARAFLKPFLNTDDIQHLLLLTHGGTPHSYVLIYNELVDENIGLVFNGQRDFKKIELINESPQLLKSIPASGSEQFINFLWSLTDGPPKYSGPLGLQENNDNAYKFIDGLTIKHDMSEATIASQQYGKGKPRGIIFLKDGHIVKKIFPDASLGYMVVLYEEDNQLTCRLMDQKLADSLLIKMYFFDAKGLQHFKLIKSSSDLTSRTKIKIFEMN